MWSFQGMNDYLIIKAKEIRTHKVKPVTNSYFNPKNSARGPEDARGIDSFQFLNGLVSITLKLTLWNKNHLLTDMY